MYLWKGAVTARPSSVVPLSQDVLLKLYNTLQTKEKKLYGNTTLPIDRFDVMFLVQSIFHQRSILSGKSIAGTKLVRRVAAPLQ